MQLSTIRIVGFRNYKDATINLSPKALIVGANEVGKSNFIQALRLLLDPSLPETALEPLDSDFCIYSDTNEILIQLVLSDIQEECLLARLREHVGDNGKMYLVYRGLRDPRTNRRTYSVSVGRTPEDLVELETRYYTRVLNLKFVGSRRDLFSYIGRERRFLLQDAREGRNQEEVDGDNTILGRVETRLAQIREDVSSLAYVARATDLINDELETLSHKNAEQEIVFDTQASNPSGFIDDLRLSARHGERVLAVGGDGRLNQIHLALWAARNRMATSATDEPLEVSIYCIEEPEAHLHPHQQRKLASYLADTLQAQVIITTHSPQIACEFAPSAIVRLCDESGQTLAAGNGVSPFIEKALIDFGYRMNIIPAEAFFSAIALLVEGQSEVLLYGALADAIGIDLDRMNISILAVEGIGFKPYASLFSSLGIPFVIRTDNDIMKIPGAERYRYAGILRAIDLVCTYRPDAAALRTLADEMWETLNGTSSPDPAQAERAVLSPIVERLAANNIFLAERDLETDLVNSPVFPVLCEFAEVDEPLGLITKMKERKASFMFSFLHQRADCLELLRGHGIAAPIIRCDELAR